MVGFSGVVSRYHVRPNNVGMVSGVIIPPDVRWKLCCELIYAVPPVLTIDLAVTGAVARAKKSSVTPNSSNVVSEK
jgi:hypothetical protein